MARGLASQAGVDLGKAAPPVQFAGISEIVMMSATELAQAIQSRSVFCAEVMSAYLDHIDRMNSHVNAIACPALAVPAGFNDAGLPTGLQIVAPNHGELACLQLAYAYDEATGWIAKRMPAPLASG